VKPETEPSRLWLVLLLALFALAGLVILPLPLLRDQGIYAYVAWGWVNDRIPYRDAFEHKGPLLYAVYAAALTFSKGAMWGPNLADLLARTSAVFFAYGAGARLLGRRAGLYAALFTALPLGAVFNSCWWNAEAETFMLPLLPLSFALALRAGSLSRFLAGFLSAQAAALKPTALLHALFLLVPASNNLQERKGAAAFLAGLIAGIAPWIAYFAAQDALPDAYAALLVFNSFHAGLAPGASWTKAFQVGGRGAVTVFGLLLVLANFLAPALAAPGLDSFGAPSGGGAGQVFSLPLAGRDPAPGAARGRRNGLGARPLPLHLGLRLRRAGAGPGGH